MDGDEDDVLSAQLSAPLVHAAAALGQGDVRFLGYRAVRASTMPRAMMRFSRYSSRRPSGERLPRVSAPWPLSMRIFIAD